MSIKVVCMCDKEGIKLGGNLFIFTAVTENAPQSAPLEVSDPPPSLCARKNLSVSQFEIISIITTTNSSKEFSRAFLFNGCQVSERYLDVKKAL